jgi:hypothetical protein
MKYSSQAAILQDVVGCVSSLTTQSKFISDPLPFQATMPPVLPAGTTLVHKLGVLDLVAIVGETSDSLCL